MFHFVSAKPDHRLVQVSIHFAIHLDRAFRIAQRVDELRVILEAFYWVREQLRQPARVSQFRLREIENRPFKIIAACR